MNVTSKIQRIMSVIQAKSDFRESLENLMEKYNIKDSIFSYNGKTNEVCNGYFVPKATFESLNEAISSMEDFSYGIRIINNEKFEVGKVNSLLSECEGEVIYDIKTAEIC